MSYNMRISPYLCPCGSGLAARFSNLTKVECSHRRGAITYTHDIFHNRCKRPHHATRKNSNLYIERKCHRHCKKIPITFEQGCTPCREHHHWEGSVGFLEASSPVQKTPLSNQKSIYGSFLGPQQMCRKISPT